MNRSRQFLFNSTSAALLQIVTIISGFIIPRVMLTIYGSEINGLVSSISQFISYFYLVEAGLAHAAVYSLYEPLANNDNKRINQILSASRLFYNQTGFIFISLVLGLSIIYPTFVKSSSVGAVEIGLLVLIIGCSGAIEFFTMSKYRVLLTADQKVYVISLASIASIVFMTLIIAFLASYEVNIVILRAIALIAVLLRSIILYWYVRLKYDDVNYHANPDYKALNKRWDALYLQLLGTAQTAAPVIIATLFTSLKLVSVYSIYSVVLGGIMGMLAITLNSLFASFGDVIARKQLAILKQAYQELELLFYMLITFVYGCSFILIMPFIKLYTSGVTDVNYYQPILGMLFVLNGLLYNIKNPQGMLVISAGLFRETRVQATIQGLIIVVFGLVLVQFWGLVGVVVGAILSNLYRDIDLLFYIPKKVTDLPARLSFFRVFRIFVCIGFILLPFRYISLEITNYLEWLTYGFMISVYAIFVTIGINIIFDRYIFISAMRRIYDIIARN